MLKRILAFLGIFLMLSLYGSVIVFSLLDHPIAKDMLMLSVAATVVIPILLYGYQLIYKYLKNNDK